MAHGLAVIEGAVQIGNHGILRHELAATGDHCIHGAGCDHAIGELNGGEAASALAIYRNSWNGEGEILMPGRPCARA